MTIQIADPAHLDTADPAASPEQRRDDGAVLQALGDREERTRGQLKELTGIPYHRLNDSLYRLRLDGRIQVRATVAFDYFRLTEEEKDRRRLAPAVLRPQQLPRQWVQGEQIARASFDGNGLAVRECPVCFETIREGVHGLRAYNFFQHFAACRQRKAEEKKGQQV